MICGRLRDLNILIVYYEPLHSVFYASHTLISMLAYAMVFARSRAAIFESQHPKQSQREWVKRNQ